MYRPAPAEAAGIKGGGGGEGRRGGGEGGGAGAGEDDHTPQHGHRRADRAAGVRGLWQENTRQVHS